MPRQARESSGTGIYHVMMRGINHQNIFEEQEELDHITNQEVAVWYIVSHAESADSTEIFKGMQNT